MLAAILALGLSGCRTTPAPEAPAPHDFLVIGVNADVGSLNPLTYAAASDQNVILPLTVPTIEPRFDCRFEGTPGYAKSWSWSDDGKVVSLELRGDLVWEDGVPVTADDVAFTFDAVADPKTGSPRMSIVQDMVEGARPKVIDATHVEFHFARPLDRAAQLAYIGDLGLLPEHKWKDVPRAEFAAHPMSRAPLSYGPFRLERWDAGQQLVLTRNERFQPPAPLRQVVLRVLPDYATRLAELENGGIDLMDQVQVADADRLRETHPELRLARRGWRSTYFVAWNTRRPQLADPAVRRALAEAVDVDQIIAKLYTSKTGEAYARRAIGTITPALCDAYNDAIAPIPFDAAGARAKLAALGWKDADGDGVLDRKGQPLSFRLLVNAENKVMGDVALLVQSSLRDAGVRAEIDAVPKATVTERLLARDYDAAVAGWSANLFADPSSVWQCESEAEPRPYNYTGFCDPEVDRLISDGLSRTIPTEAGPVWKELQARVYEQQPYLFLFWTDEIVAVHSRYEHTAIDVLAPYGRLYEWSVRP